MAVRNRTFSLASSKQGGAHPRFKTISGLPLGYEQLRRSCIVTIGDKDQPNPPILHRAVEDATTNAEYCEKLIEAKELAELLRRKILIAGNLAIAAQANQEPTDVAALLDSD